MQKRAGLLLFGWLAGPFVASAQVIPVGSEFQVNTYTTADQFQADVCKAPDGRFVVVFQSAGNDGDEYGVFGQRYASDGSTLGTEFQINTYTRGEQAGPQVCCDAGGNFVVTWESIGQDGSGDGIFGQRFASDGTRRGTEFLVNTYTRDAQSDAHICCAQDGDFVVVWSSYGQDGDSLGVFGQRFASDGDLLGKEFQVNTYTHHSQDDAAICCDKAGDFVVVWESLTEDGSDQGVFGQRFAGNGTPRGTEFQVNTYTSLSQNYPAICCTGDGSFVVVWDSADGSGHGIFGQRFASDGLPSGQQFQANTFTSSEQRDASICCGPNGDFVVTWQSERKDGSEFGIVGRHFNAGGGAMPEFQVNTYTSLDQTYPAVACDSKGNFVVVWTSDRQDGSREGVFGQRFELLGVVTSPVMSFAGLVVVVASLFGCGLMALRRRARRP